MPPKKRGGKTKGASSSSIARVIKNFAKSTTKPRPPPIDSGNPSPRSLLVDDTAIARYIGFQSRDFVPMLSISQTFIDSLMIEHLDDYFQAQNWGQVVINFDEPIYPSCVAQFFANLKVDPINKNSLLSTVNQIPISIRARTINEIFGTKFPSNVKPYHYWNDRQTWPLDKNLFDLGKLQDIFNTTATEAKFFNPTNLPPSDRVIYFILINFLHPVAGHFTSPGKVPLVWYYFFIHKIPIDWGWIMYAHLSDMTTDARRNLHFAQFLNPIFKHFQVPIQEVGVPPIALDMSTFSKKGIVLHKGNWITREQFKSLGIPKHHGSSSKYTSTSSSQASMDVLLTRMDKMERYLKCLEHGLILGMPPETRAKYMQDRGKFDLDMIEGPDQPILSEKSSDDSLFNSHSDFEAEDQRPRKGKNIIVESSTDDDATLAATLKRKKKKSKGT